MINEQYSMIHRPIHIVADKIVVVVVAVVVAVVKVIACITTQPHHLAAVAMTMK
jgi:hypothetical protein